MDGLLEQVQKELIERRVKISVFRQNASLPKELLSMISRIDEHAQIEKNQQEFHSNFSRLTSKFISLLIFIRNKFRLNIKRFIPCLFHDNLKTSICFYNCRRAINKGKLFFQKFKNWKNKIPHNYIHNLNMCLSLAAILPTRLDCFFQNGQLKPFFKVLFGELDLLNKTVQNCWVSWAF